MEHTTNANVNDINNKGKRWTAEEELQLWDEFFYHIPIESIALIHGRTVKGIEMRIEKLLADRLLANLASDSFKRAVADVASTHGIPEASIRGALSRMTSVDILTKLGIFPAKSTDIKKEPAEEVKEPEQTDIKEPVDEVKKPEVKMTDSAFELWFIEQGARREIDAVRACADAFSTDVRNYINCEVDRIRHSEPNKEIRLSQIRALNKQRTESIKKIRARKINKFSEIREQVSMQIAGLEQRKREQAAELRAQMEKQGAADMAKALEQARKRREEIREQARKQFKESQSVTPVATTNKQEEPAKIQPTPVGPSLRQEMEATLEQKKIDDALNANKLPCWTPNQGNFPSITITKKLSSEVPAPQVPAATPEPAPKDDKIEARFTSLENRISQLVELMTRAIVMRSVNQ